MNPAEPAPGAPALVLDTNAVLDWLIFQDAGMCRVARAIESGLVRWLIAGRMRDEFQRTLTYPALARWQPDAEPALDAFDRWSRALPEPERCRHGPLMCSDADDQVFIDLASAHAARWLVTHDRALHKLARPAARAGVRVVRPKDWCLAG